MPHELELVLKGKGKKYCVSVYIHISLLCQCRQFQWQNQLMKVVAILIKSYPCGKTFLSLTVKCKPCIAVVFALCNLFNSVTCHTWWVNCLSSSTSRKYKTNQIWIHAMWNKNAPLVSDYMHLYITTTGYFKF